MIISTFNLISQSLELVDQTVQCADSINNIRPPIIAPDSEASVPRISFVPLNDLQERLVRM